MRYRLRRRPGALPRGPGRVRNGRGTSAGAGDVRYGGNSDGQGRRGQVVLYASLFPMSHNWRLIPSIHYFIRIKSLLLGI